MCLVDRLIFGETKRIPYVRRSQYAVTGFEARTQRFNDDSGGLVAGMPCRSGPFRNGPPKQRHMQVAAAD